jgi:membrane protein
LFDFFKENLPTSVDQLESNIDNTIRLRGPIGIIGFARLIWAGSAMFGAISRAVNRAWGIRKDRPFYVKKIRDLAMALSAGLLIGLSIGLTSGVQILRSTDVSLPYGVVETFTRILGLIITFGIFLLIYRFVPSMKVYWRYVWPGAILGAILFEIAKTLFVFYLANFSNYEMIYGSVASSIILLFWVYISAFTLILGAEFSFNTVRCIMVKTSPPLFPQNQITRSSDLSSSV